MIEDEIMADLPALNIERKEEKRGWYGMKIPNANQAIITRDKICEYLLNPAHKRGSS